MVTEVRHTLVCGATRSGKSAAELARLVPLARGQQCALVVLDPPGGLAAQLLLHLDSLGLTHRVLYDRLADTDRVPGYDWLSASTHPDPFQRSGENDERVREFAAILLRRRGGRDIALSALIEETLLAALRLYVHQATPVPLPWLAEVFTRGAPARSHLLTHCTEPSLVQKFEELASLGPTARRAETAPAERILRAVLESPSFRVRSGDPTLDLDRFLDDRGILLLDGSSQGNLSRDAASVMMGAVILKVIAHCRTGAKCNVLLVLDEATNAGLLGLHESQALAESGKGGLQCHVLVQSPFGFPSEEIQRNVLQNCWRHEWFRQGSPEAARLAAEDLATPLLDPLKVHHTEYRIRTVDAGFERVQTADHSEWTDPEGRTTGRTRSWRTVLWPRRREVKDAQQRYTALQDQILLLQKDLMLLQPGYRFVRGDTVTPTPEYVPLLRTPWDSRDAYRITFEGTPAGTLATVRLRSVLAAMKRRSAFRVPSLESPPPASSRSQAAAAATLATRTRS
jgi:hypothetical protein